MSTPTLPPVPRRARVRNWAKSALVFVVLSTSAIDCPFLDLLTALYTGSYQEFVECPQSFFDCADYFFPQDIMRCILCDFDDPNASSGGLVEAHFGGGVELFWTENNKRVLSTLNAGANAREVIDLGRRPAGLALNPTTGLLYWVELRTDTIRRSALDGTNEVVLLSNIPGATGLVLDAAGGKLYWGTIDGTLQRANLDGSGLETLISGLDGPTNLVLDGAGGKLYWTSLGTLNQKIQRANLDGSGLEDLITGLTLPFGLALHTGTGKLYWSDMQDGAIRRANLDGSGVEDVTTGLPNLGSIALDEPNGHIYYVDVENIGLRRMNLDGTGVLNLTTFNPAAGIALDLAGGKIYWTGWLTGTINRANLDGTQQEVLAFDERITGDVAVDDAGGKVYWAKPTTATLQRANFDGSGVEDIATSQFGLGAVAFDPVARKLYWTNNGEIIQADPDGTNPTAIVTNVIFIGDLEVDVDNRQLYWVNRQQIQRSNLDGTGIGTVVNDPSFPSHLAIHGSGGTPLGTDMLYWTVPGAGVIRHVPLDGSAPPADLITGLSLPEALEAAGGQLFWSLPTLGDAQQSNLDGTGITTIFTTVPGISGLTASQNVILPVELTRFDARTHDTAVTLTWETASETHNAGFEVETRHGAALSEGAWETVAFVDGHGTTTEPQTYTHRLTALDAGRHRFRLKQIDFDGTFAYSPELEVALEIPTTHIFTAAYPNPFVASATFTLTVAEAQDVQVAVYDLQGRLVQTLHTGRLPAQTTHTFTLDGTLWPSGIYHYQVTGETFSEGREIVLLH